MKELENVNATTLTIMAKAAGYAMAHLAVEGERLIPRWNQTTGALRIRDKEIAWGVEEGGRHTGCGKGDE